MKALAIVLFIIPFWTSNALAQDKDIKELLDNSETRTEIFNTILNNHQLMMGFMDAMKTNNHAMMMIQGDSDIMGSSSMGGMHDSGEHQMMGMNNDNSEMMNHMMSMMKDNPGMMQKMMGNMMDMCEKDSTKCEHMAEIMSEHPHMMMMGEQKMKEKGNDNQHSNMKMNN